MASPQPRIGVVTYPGSQDDRDALWALAALDAEAVAVWHEERELPGPRRGRRCRAASRTATTSAAARSRASRRRRPRCASSRTRAGSCSGSATASRSSARPGLLPGRAAAERVAALRLPRRPADASSGTTCRSPSRCDRRPAARDPGQARRRPLRPAARISIPAQVVLRYLDNPNGSVDDDRRRLQRGRQRHGAHAAPRACGRSAARLRPRRAASSPRSSTPRANASLTRCVASTYHPERLRERRVLREGRLAAVRCPARGGSPARARRRRRPRRRSARAAPPSPSRAAGRFDANRFSPACCGTVSSSTRSAGPHGVAAFAMTRTLARDRRAMFVAASCRITERSARTRTPRRALRPGRAPSPGGSRRASRGAPSRDRARSPRRPSRRRAPGSSR